MKFGFRTPSVKKSVKARTTGKAKRSLKKSVNPLYGKKGTGYITDPKKAVYNKVYNKTTFGAKDVYDAIDFDTHNNSNSYTSNSSNQTNISTDNKRKTVQVPVGEHDATLVERIIHTLITVALLFFAIIIITWLFQYFSYTFQFILIGIALVLALLLVSNTWTTQKITEYKKVYKDELTEEDINNINYYKEKAKNEFEENKKPFYKNWKVYISVIILVISALIGNGADKSNSNNDTEPISGIESIALQEYSKKDINIIVDSWLSKEKVVKADVTYNSTISFDELNDYIEFVIDDEEIATVKSITFDDSYKYQSTVPVTCTLVGVNNGTTTGYFQTTDGKIKSYKINITVAGLLTKEEEVSSNTSTTETNIETPTIQGSEIIKESTTKDTLLTESSSTQKETSTQKPTTTQSNKTDGTTVYVTPTGKRYHLDPECGGKNSSPRTLDYAISLGLTPCQKCAQ